MKKMLLLSLILSLFFSTQAGYIVRGINTLSKRSAICDYPDESMEKVFKLVK